LETLVATALLGLAVLASAGLLVRCHRIAAGIEERTRAEHAAATEMDTLLAAGPAALGPGEHSWQSGADAASGLPGARGVVSVEPYRETEVLLVRVRLEWGEGKSLVRETLAGGTP
jgi:hypothetical protein